LTFERTDSIYESRCDFLFESQIRNGESIDEERNQESCRKEESPSEEKEVARQHQQQRKRPLQRGLFFFGRPCNGAFFIDPYFFTNF
jgi:hypothetical protein